MTDKIKFLHFGRTKMNN